MSVLGPWDYSCDVDATIAAYGRIEIGVAATCACAGCRNFVQAREHVFTAPFLAISSSLGIDPRKDAQLSQYHRFAPGRHGYLGAFVFVGELRTLAPHARVTVSPGLDVALSATAPPRDPAFEGLPVLALDFHAEGVPWVLDEPEIE